jgi:hypothetical protein
MSSPSTPDKTPHAEPPLWSIGLAIVIILGAPLVLYSLAPSGPLREGDTVFSDGEQRVRLNRPVEGQQFQPGEICLLDPNSPLIIIQGPNDRPDGAILAHVQGHPAEEWPFCPLHAEVLLDTHQVFQKPEVFGVVKEILTKLSSR